MRLCETIIRNASVCPDSRDVVGLRNHYLLHGPYLHLGPGALCVISFCISCTTHSMPVRSTHNEVMANARLFMVSVYLPV